MNVVTIGKDISKAPYKAIIAIWAVLVLVEFLAILVKCSGHFVFPLDDPYVHLSVADQILHDGYGVNSHEYSSPSSSILWPYLLAVTQFLHLGAYGALILNLVAALLSVIVYTRALDTVGIFSANNGPIFKWTVAILSIFVMSAIALPFIGMEHSLHVLLTLVVFSGLLRASKNESLSWVHFVALVALPLIRFEGFAFALGALVALAFLGRRVFAASALIAMAALLSAYVLRMHALGLPLLPSSVLLKSQVAAQATENHSPFYAVYKNLSRIHFDHSAQILAAMVIALPILTWRNRSRVRVTAVALPVVFAVAAHLLVGHYGWFYRYAVYILALSNLCLIYLLCVSAQKSRGVLSQPSRALVLLPTLLIALHYMAAAKHTPTASDGIFHQQYQMGIFAKKFYKRPIAVNDLGLVSFGNPEYVLDLWGLGSETVRKDKMAHHYGPEEISGLTESHHVGLAMIYKNWFANKIPQSWKAVAVLHTHSITAAANAVTFYMTPTGDPQYIHASLEAFKKVLPKGSRLEITPTST